MTESNPIRAAIIWSGLTLLAFAVLIGLALCSSCTNQPATDAAAEHTAKAVATAREHLDTVAKVLEAAQPALTEAPAVNAELVAFREAYDAGENSAAAGHLRSAIDHAIAAGLDVPPEIPERLGQAELLLQLVGE